MYYAQIREYDIANGEGIRVTLFVSGCTHHCKGCFNQEYMNFSYGNEWTKHTEDLFLSYCKNPMIYGVTILGGEPFDQTKDRDLVHLLGRIKKETSHNIWIYSGYTFEQIIKDPLKKEILCLCDILVDGPYIEALKDLRLSFKGSSNQRIIDIAASLAKQEVVLKNIE